MANYCKGDPQLRSLVLDLLMNEWSALGTRLYAAYPKVAVIKLVPLESVLGAVCSMVG